MNAQGVAFLATASEAVVVNVAVQNQTPQNPYTTPKQSSKNGFFSGFITYRRQSLPVSVHLEENGWFGYSKFSAPPRSEKEAVESNNFNLPAAF